MSPKTVLEEVEMVEEVIRSYAEEYGCMHCKFFKSFYIAYDNDPFEPDNQGFCKCPKVTEEMEEIAGVTAQGCDKREPLKGNK